MAKVKSPSLQQVQSCITVQCLIHLKKGIIPWHMEWQDMPKEDDTGRPYFGINSWFLGNRTQIKDILDIWSGIKKYTKGHKWVREEHFVAPSEKDKNHSRQIAFSYVLTGNNYEKSKVEQAIKKKISSDPKKRCADIVRHVPEPPSIEVSPAGHYSYLGDRLSTPEYKSCQSNDEFYSTLFYFLVESTGHPKRLNRTTSKQRGYAAPKVFGLEDLILEMGCAYLCSYAGIEPWYLKVYHSHHTRWIEHLVSDETLVYTAAKQAQEAVDYIINCAPLVLPIPPGGYTSKTMDAYNEAQNHFNDLS